MEERHERYAQLFAFGDHVPGSERGTADLDDVGSFVGEDSPAGGTIEEESIGRLPWYGEGSHPVAPHPITLRHCVAGAGHHDCLANVLRPLDVPRLFGEVSANAAARLTKELRDVQDRAKGARLRSWECAGGEPILHPDRRAEQLDGEISAHAPAAIRIQCVATAMFCPAATSPG